MFSTPVPHVACFGRFAVDLRTGELFKNGRKLRLQDQPFQVLALLLERPGELVSREDLRDKLWPGNTFVDFDDGLNTVIRKVRQVLCDSPEHPRYIETLPRRGYRFIAPVKIVSVSANGPRRELTAARRGAEPDHPIGEFCEGESIEECLRRGALSVSAVAQLGIQLAEALRAAHSRGVSYGGLRPHNIMLVNDGCTLVDSGRSGTTQTDPRRTASETLPYMSPERVAGGDNGPADDIFALGAVLYEMLAGQRAFDGPTDASIVGAIVHGHPQWEILRTSRIPASLTRLIQECLNKRHSDRPTAQEVARRLVLMRTRTHARSSVAQSKSCALSLGLVPFVGLDQQGNVAVLDLLERELLRLGNLRIVRAAHEPRQSDTDSSVLTLAKDLRANLLMLGVIDQSDDRKVFRIRVVEPIAARQLYARTFVETDSGYVACAQSLARALVPELANVLHRPARSVRRVNGSPRAEELYVEGRYHWNKRTRQGNESARQCFLTAIDEDRLWALPHAGLADCHVMTAVAGWANPATNYDQARAAANKALVLDRRAAEPHATLGTVYWLADWNWRAAENEFQTALSLNPGYGEAYMWCGRHFSMRGRHDEALKNLTLAWKLDPLSKAVSLAIGIAWYAARQFETASAHFDEIVRDNPSWCNALYFAGLSHLMLGHIDVATETLQRATAADQTTRRPLVGLAQAYWMAGEKRAAKAVFSELIANDSKHYVSPCDVAEVLSVFGDRQGCIEWLRKAVDERCGDLAGLRTDPMYDGMRTTAEFSRIESLVFGDA